MTSIVLESQNLYTGPTLSGMHFWLTYLQWQSVKPECENTSWSSFYFTKEEQQHSWHWTGKPESSQNFSLQPSVSERTQIRGIYPFSEILLPGPLKSTTVRWRQESSRAWMCRLFLVWKGGLQAVIQSSVHCCTAVRDLSWAQARPRLFSFLLGARLANSRSAVLWSVQPLKATWGLRWCESLCTMKEVSQTPLNKYLARSRS